MVSALGLVSFVLGFGFKLALCLLLVCGGAWAQVQVQSNPTFEWSDRWQLYVHRTYSWQRLTFLGFDTALDHLQHSPREWDRSSGSYFRRYGRSFGGRVVRNSIELGVGAALGEDLRFQLSRDRSFGGRIRHAGLQSFTALHGDRREFAYSRLAGSAGRALVGSAWDPCRLTPTRFAEAIGFDFLGSLQNSLLNEFSPDLKAFGRSTRRKLLRK